MQGGRSHPDGRDVRNQIIRCKEPDGGPEWWNVCTHAHREREGVGGTCSRATDDLVISSLSDLDPPSRSSITRSMGILPFRQLMYR